MNPTLFQKLELAISARNKAVAEKLNVGLSKDAIRNLLTRAEIGGDVEVLVYLYSWKNGTRSDGGINLSQLSVLPASIYQFTDLETAIMNLNAIDQTVEWHPLLNDIDRRYFPILWDNSTGFLVVDLKPSQRNRVMMMEFESERPLIEAYVSFEDFLADVIRANEEDEALACFHQ